MQEKGPAGGNAAGQATSSMGRRPHRPPSPVSLTVPHLPYCYKVRKNSKATNRP